MLAGQASRRRGHVGDQDEKRAFEVESDGLQPVGPGATSFDSTVLDFGHHLFEGDPAAVRASAEVRAAYLGEEAAV